MAAVIISAVLYSFDTYMETYETIDENTTIYLELNEYQQKLKRDINQYKEELDDKRAYMESLDKQLAELDYKYVELLEERKRISNKLNSLNATKGNK